MRRIIPLISQGFFFCHFYMSLFINSLLYVHEVPNTLLYVGTPYKLYDTIQQIYFIPSALLGNVNHME